METISNKRIAEALESTRCVDPNAKLTALPEGGWKIESVCQTYGAWIDFYGQDGRLTAHLKND